MKHISNPPRRPLAKRGAPTFPTAKGAGTFTKSVRGSSTATVDFRVRVRVKSKGEPGPAFKLELAQLIAQCLDGAKQGIYADVRVKHHYVSLIRKFKPIKWGLR